MGAARFSVPRRVRDALVAAGLAASLLLTAWMDDAAGPPNLLGLGLLALSALVLAAARSAPVAVLTVTALCTVGYQAAGVDVPAVAFLFAVFAAMRAGRRVATGVVALATLGAFALVEVLRLEDVSAALTHGRRPVELAWLVAAAAAGEALRQAERRADEAERTREAVARRRADEERLRIARELHDSLTHQIAIIKVQADVAVRVARRRGDPASDAVLAIQTAGGEAMRELRATLSALRDDDATTSRGLDDVPELVERTRAIGVDATLTIEGERRALPSAVDRTAYRIVQESLTNIARHAGATTASVRIDCRPDSMAIRIDDDGRATPGVTPVLGVGLLGMQERVAALGGRLSAGARSQGGFMVLAELPVERTP